VVFFEHEPSGIAPVQDFTGARSVSAVNSLMIKRALLVALGLLALCFPVAAQQTNRTDGFDAAAALALYRPEIFASVDSSVLVRDLPMLTFLDGRLPGSTALGRMGMAPVANLPVALVSAAKVQKINASPVSGKDGKDSPRELVSPPLNPVYYGGEVGFFYGHSSGKFGGDEFGTYIEGGVGNDKFQINAGAAYQEWNGRVPRFRH